MKGQGQNTGRGWAQTLGLSSVSRALCAASRPWGGGPTSPSPRRQLSRAFWEPQLFRTTLCWNVYWLHFSGFVFSLLFSPKGGRKHKPSRQRCGLQRCFQRVCRLGRAFVASWRADPSPGLPARRTRYPDSPPKPSPLWTHSDASPFPEARPRRPSLPRSGFVFSSHSLTEICEVFLKTSLVH